MAEAAIDYNELKSSLTNGDPKVRLRIAADPAMPAEFLYFLAEDKVVEVRRAVAENPSTPNQAAMLLARDEDYGVRCALARKVVGIGLADGERRGLWRMGFTILETLACDQLVRVRRILAEAFCTPPDAPPEIVRTLARDRREEVAAQVLRNSPVLTDEDIVDIVDHNAPDWAFEAVAGRESISPAVTEVLARSPSLAAVGAMVSNPGADISEPVMGGIVDRAADAHELQEPLVNRPSLSSGLMIRLARFVAAPLLAVLQQRDGLDEETAASLDRVAEQRGEAVSSGGRRKGLIGGKRKGKNGGRKDSGDAGAQSGKGSGKSRRTSDTAISAAMDSGNAETIVEGLAERAGYPAALAHRMVFSGSARTITALCWKAGVSMRFALDVQRRIGHIAPQSLLYARDGFDYPLSQHEMEEQLSLFTG